jgi:hypothetical protein
MCRLENVKMTGTFSKQDPLTFANFFFILIIC